MRTPERFVRSTKQECADRMIPLAEMSSATDDRRVQVEHYHRERNHQGLANELIESALTVDHSGRIRRRQRLDGLLNYYRRAA